MLTSPESVWISTRAPPLPCVKSSSLPGVYLLVLRAVWPKQFLIVPLKDSRSEFGVDRRFRHQLDAAADRFHADTRLRGQVRMDFDVARDGAHLQALRAPQSSR